MKQFVTMVLKSATVCFSDVCMSSNCNYFGEYNVIITGTKVEEMLEKRKQQLLITTAQQHHLSMSFKTDLGVCILS